MASLLRTGKAHLLISADLLRCQGYCINCTSAREPSRTRALTCTAPPLGISGLSNKFAVVIAPFALSGSRQSADRQQNHCCAQPCEASAHHGLEFFNVVYRGRQTHDFSPISG